MTIDKEFENSFKAKIGADVKQYRAFMKQYASLTSEDYTNAYNISQNALVLADRWIDIQAEATKENVAELRTTKTDFGKWAYQHYSQLHKVFEHSRVVWNNGEKFHRELDLMDKRRKTHE